MCKNTSNNQVGPLKLDFWIIGHRTCSRRFRISKAGLYCVFSEKHVVGPSLENPKRLCVVDLLY